MPLPRWTPFAGGLLVAGVSVVLAGVATPVQLDALQVVCGQDICETLEQPTRDLLAQVARVGLSARGWAVGVVVAQWALLVSFCVLGLIMVWRRPSILAAASGIGLMLVALQGFLPAYDAHGPALALLVAVSVLNQVALFLILALFPDGRWHSRSLRTWAVPLVAAISMSSALRTAGAPSDFWDAIQVIAIVSLVLTQVHRYFRHSDWAARQQAKWVLVGFCVLASVIGVSGILSARGLMSQLQLPMVIAVYAAFLLIGLGFTFAVLRYRLFDVGAVLWRTFVYGSGLVAALSAYFLLVALAGLSVGAQTASVLGIAVIAAVILGGGWVAGRFRIRLRERLYGTGNVAASLASTIASPTGTGVDLASAVARALALRHVEVRDSSGVVVSTFGAAPPADVIREQVIDSRGHAVGELRLAAAYGDQLDPRDRRALTEVMPFVVLLLRAQHETEELKQARTAAASSREDERRRLRRDLHDGVGPLLASQLITLDTIKLAREKGIPDGVLYQSLEGQTRAAISEIRSITRDLRPPALDVGGLAAAVKASADQAAATGLAVRATVDLDDAPLAAAVEVNILRIVQEALTNVTRHAEATRVDLAVVMAAGAADITITDDGRGRGNAEPGVGTTSMKERAEELGGSLTVSPGPQGAGTTVHARIPL